MTFTDWIELLIGINFVIVVVTISSYLLLMRRVFQHLRQFDSTLHERK